MQRQMIDSNATTPETIIIISQNTQLAGILGSVLGSEYAMVTASDIGSATLLFSNQSVSAAVLDIGVDCIQAQSRTVILDKLLAHDMPVIILATDDRRDEALDLVERGAQSFVRNPPALRELKTALRNACQSCTLNSEIASTRKELESVRGLDQLVGSGAPMQQVYKLIRKVANLENSVLITGESGTGKELIARAIHNTGNRSHRPFVAVSCGAIPETLIESELFGHEKGAFTGTVGQREGYLEKAGDGTLFLDEIGELNPQIQVKLLRVLQEREFNRLGSSRAIPLRARIVLATHRDLEQMVAAGEFRQDLYYRINVMNVKAPALRRHAEDIPLLVPHFIHKYAEAYRKPIEGIEPDALALLQAYSWPGNVRELENIVQRSIIMAEGYTIGVEDLPEALQDLDPQDFENDQLPAGSFERLVREYKVKLAMDAIQHSGGNKTLAAQSLWISRAYLHRLVRPGATGPVESAVAEIGSGRSRLPLVVGL